MFRSGGGGRACRAVVRSFVGGGALRRPGAVLWSSSSATCVPVGWVARARVPSRSLSASIAPVLCCLCRPFARGCLCVCPFPLPSAHSPTRYTLPPEAGCRGHHPACGRPRVCAPTRPAASPSRILFALHVLAHSHTLALAHSHTLTLATHSRSLAHSHSPCPLLAKALSPSCRPCRVHCPCLVSPGIVAVVARSFCSCLSSRHVMLVVSPFPLAVLVMSPPPVPVPCCPTVPWRRAVLAAAVCAPVPSVASAAPGEVPPGHVPLVSRAVVVCRGGRADRQLVEAGHGVPVEEGLDVSVRLEL